MNSKFIKFLFPIIVAALAFWAGMWWQRQVYIDTCLDMGGGWNPDGYPICVLEKIVERPATAPTDSKNQVYDCDGKAKVTANFIGSEFVAVSLSRPGQADLAFSAILSPSGSGAKYSSGDGIFVFWEKGGECMVLEGERTLFSGCR